ncbi:hypothetical protein Pla175_28790 [Pirellulimonas nuda]|uniref:Dockerin domain-containing protein n=1 Tax=Pirellulimonas nuda TaxID=2528009 RepID=A0A518DDE0_9BACT|nr:hypothetical protein [Pirellulimonas nuda]QDU89488.1 hypothetical protein Pla175_28790 [Pirellulimonas nuda]
MKRPSRTDRRPPSAGACRPRFERLEERRVLSFGTFVPPVFEPAADNPVQSVRVVVLNYDPTVPSLDNRLLRDVFGWNDPHALAAGFIHDVETASGGAIDYEIVAWRDLNEFPVFTDGTRYTADQYVANRTSNSGWSSASADFYAIAEQQGLAELVNAYDIDEIWMFGDHYFNLLGEAWMAGPASFFVNGPSFPEFEVDHAVAGFGFNYERGVAEMVHNLGHRTENHISRAYGGWDIANPATPWDLFTANVAQSNTAAYGVGSVHYPFNGASDYDYANTRTLASYADDFVANFPNQAYAAEATSRDAWGDYDVGDWQRGYLNWFFGHVPREGGEATDGRANNWYKYIYDFNAYRPGSGLARDDEAVLAAPTQRVGGADHYLFSLRYYDAGSIDPLSLDGADVLVQGPNGFSQLASLSAVGESRSTTAGSARTVQYRIEAPGGAWEAADSGVYTVTLRPGEVRDAQGAYLPAAGLGTFRVDVSDAGRLDVAALLAAGQASVGATPWDIGSPADLFDGVAASLYRSANLNPAVVTLAFDQAQQVDGAAVRISHAGGDPAYQWRLEAADTLADLDGGVGSHRLLVPTTGIPADQTSTRPFGQSVSARFFRLTVERLTGDDYVHINAWDLLTTPVEDALPPTAASDGGGVTSGGETTHGFTVAYADDLAIDITTINYGDIRVRGPNGYLQVAALAGLDLNANGPSRAVAYFVAAPGGLWDAGDNGVYTIEIVAGQVMDTAGKGVAPGVIGAFEVSIPTLELRPLADMTELNAGSWLAWADGAAASTSDDPSRTVLGAGSVRFDTTGGFDTYLRYAPAWGAQWDLRDASEFRFSLYAENPSPVGFQDGWLRFFDAEGATREFHYFQDGNPGQPWNDARGAWLPVTIPIQSDQAPPTGWRADAGGPFDWGRVTGVEVHADTWDAGFALWLDRAGFDLPIGVASGAFTAAAEQDQIDLVFDAPGVLFSASAPFSIEDASSGAMLPAEALGVATLPSGGEQTAVRIGFPGFAEGRLPAGVYRLVLPVGSVLDAAGNSLAGRYELAFSTLPGDYNADAAVDHDDYAAWRAGFGATSGLGLRSDGNGDGVVDAADYAVWRDHLGTSIEGPGPAAASASASPLASTPVGAAPPAGRWPAFGADRRDGGERSSPACRATPRDRALLLLAAELDQGWRSGGRGDDDGGDRPQDRPRGRDEDAPAGTRGSREARARAFEGPLAGAPLAGHASLPRPRVTG